MSSRQVVPEARLRDLAGWLASWPWPLPEAAVHELAAARGWVLAEHEPGSAARWGVPGLVGAEPWAEVTVVDGEVVQVTITTSEVLPDLSADSTAFLRGVFTDQVATISRLWGPPSDRTPGARPSARWFLPSRAGLEVRGGLSCRWGLRRPEPPEVEPGPGRR